MGTIINPTYNPPVSAPRIRRIWSDIFGINGLLSGFNINTISSDANGISIQIRSGVFISDGCVVESGDVDFNIPYPDANDFYVCAYYDQSDDTVGVVVSKHPEDKWVVIGRVSNGVYTKYGSKTSYSLRTNVNAHISDSSVHISSNAHDAFVYSVEPSKYNQYLTETDTHVGTVFSAADMQIAVLGYSIENESAVDFSDPNTNMDIAVVAKGISPEYNSKVLDSYGVRKAGNVAYADVRSGFKSIQPNYSVQTFNLHDVSVVESEIKSNIEFSRYSIETSDLECTITYSDIVNTSNADTFGIPMIMVRVDNTVDKIVAYCHDGFGKRAFKEFKNIEPGTFFGVYSNELPSNLITTKSFTVKIYGQKGSIVDVSNLMQMPYILFRSYVSDLVPIKNFRVAPVCGSYEDDVVCHIKPKNRGYSYIPEFVNFNHPEASVINDEYIDTCVSIRPSKIAIQRTVSDWPDSRAGYCTAKFKDFGAMMLIGGYDPMRVPLHSSVAYSYVSKSYRTYDIDGFSGCVKSSSVCYDGEIFIAGGDGYGASVSRINGFAMISFSSASMLSDKYGHGFEKLDDTRALSWCGDSFQDPEIYNRITDTWQAMSSFTNVDYEIKSDSSPGIDGSNACLVYGSGRISGEYGSKINVSNMTQVQLNSYSIKPMTDIAATNHGYLVAQGSDANDSDAALYDMVSMTETVDDNIPVIRRGYYGNSATHNGTISYGPNEYAGVFSRAHIEYDTIGSCWIMGLAIKWEAEW